MFYDVLWCSMMFYDVLWFYLHNSDQLCTSDISDEAPFHGFTFPRPGNPSVSDMKTSEAAVLHLIVIGDGRSLKMMSSDFEGSPPYMYVCIYMYIYIYVNMYMYMYIYVWWPLPEPVAAVTRSPCRVCASSAVVQWSAGHRQLAICRGSNQPLHLRKSRSCSKNHGKFGERAEIAIDSPS